VSDINIRNVSLFSGVRVDSSGNIIIERVNVENVLDGEGINIGSALNNDVGTVSIFDCNIRNITGGYQETACGINISQ